MNVMQGNDNDSSLLHLVSTWQDQVSLRSSTGLIRGVVSALHLLDEFIELWEVFQQLRSYLGLVCKVMVDKFLQQTPLAAVICNQPVH